MRRREFKLYDVVDTEGRCKGLKNNLFPIDLEAARRLAASIQHGKPRVVRTADRAWENYVYRQRHGRRRP